MEKSAPLLQCYNRGCGQKFDPAANKDDSCCHHPGEPFFHDAYKGWSCCNRKCTDFTEFLNFKGCTLSKHTNVKPPEPEKPPKDADERDVVEVKPLVRVAKERPPFDSPMVTMKPEIAPSLKRQVLSQPVEIIENKDPSEIAVGTICKNGGCAVSYQGPETDGGVCVYHPGVPVFHEGLKFWSCCQKRTTDFNAFLNQVGCSEGKHLWIKEDENDKDVQCRWDYHQTATHVILSIYAKQYCPESSVVKLNPIRLYASLVFPQQSNAAFILDLELRGIVDVTASQVFMYGTKVEIKLRKAEPGSWSKLDVPRTVAKETKPKQSEEIAQLAPQIDAVDLDDI